MKERRKMIKHTRNKKVPEIVNQKCNEAYDVIYKECGQKSKHIFSEIISSDTNTDNNSVVYNGCDHEAERKGFWFGKCAKITALAAVAVIAVTSVTMDYIPALKSAFGFSDSEVYVENMDSITDSEQVETKTADIKLQDVYCDGENILINMTLAPKSDIWNDMTSIQVYMEVKYNGKRLMCPPYTDSYDTIQYFSKKDNDSNFYCSVKFDGVESIGITENMRKLECAPKLEIKIYHLQGENYYKQIGVVNEDYSYTYEPEKTDVIDEVYTLERNVKIDDIHNRFYEVMDTVDDITLEGVEVRPFSTTVYLNDELDSSIRYLIVHDQNGDEIKSTSSDGNRYRFETPYKTSEVLTIEVCRKDRSEFDAEYSFDVDIDEGFADKVEVEDNNEREIVYDPPQDQIDDAYNKYHQDLFNKMKDTAIPEPLGTRIAVTDSGFTHYLTITGSKMAEISDYTIEDGWQDHYVDYRSRTGTLFDAKLLLITCEIENVKNIETTFYFSGIQLISKKMWYESRYDDGQLWEADYISEIDNYGKYSNVYTLAPHETRTITVGYILSKNAIEEDGYWAVFNGEAIGSFGEIEKEVLEGTGKLYEIE